MENLQTDNNGLVKTSEYTSVNPLYATPQALTQAYNYNVGNVNNIDASKLTSQGLTFPTTPTPSTGGAMAMNAGIDTKFNQAKSEYDTLVQQQQQNAQQSANESKTSFFNALSKRAGIIENKAAAEQSPEFQAKQNALNTAYADYQTSKSEQMAEIQAVNDSTQFPDQKAQAIAQINNKYAFKNAQLSITYDIANNFLKSAQDTIDKAAQLQLDILQPEVEFFEKMLTINENKLSTSDANVLQQRLSEYENLRQSNAENVKENGAAMIRYNSMGAGITINDTPEQRAQKIASVGGEIAFNRADKLATTGGGSGDASVDFYAQLLAEGKITVSNVPQSIRNSVIVASQGVVNKPLSDTALTKINDTNFAISSLNDLRAKIQTNISQLGPITGLEALNPYSEKRKLQADIDRVRQTVGKALEGGVLRKEDEEKYKKILATITDTPETALYKIDALISSIQRNIDDYKSLQSESGRFVPTKTGTVAPEDLRAKYNY